MFEYEIAMSILNQYNRNLVTMPLTVRLGLCKLAYSGAQGEAKNEILNAFSFPSNYANCHAEVKEIVKMLQAFSVTLINKIYVNETKDLNPNFLDNSASRFGVHVQKMMFSRSKSSAMYINRWFELASFKRLHDIIHPKEVNANTSILFLSAAHIKTTWETSNLFNIFNTKTMKFRTLNGSLFDVAMMKIRGDFLHYHDTRSRFQIIRLPFLAYGMSMTIILSDLKENFASMLRGLYRNPAIIQAARHSMRFSLREVLVPRFKIRSSFSWDDVLKKAGIQQVFDPSSSGLANLLKSHYEVRNMFLSQVKQKVTIDVDEMGILRFAPKKETSGELQRKYPLMGNRKEQQFKADHPFLFTIDMQVSPQGDHTMFALGGFYGPESGNT